MFLRLMPKLTFLHFMTSTFFIICNLKFQNKVVLPRKTSEVHFKTSLNVFLVALL
jgi:hypothetical protein